MATNFPNGLLSMGVPVNGMFTQGKSYFVKPYSGNDGNSGKTPVKAVKTLAKALSLATADQNDVIYLCAESNTASLTTDYQSSTLTWNKDGVHLIGISAGNAIGSRARVAMISSWTAASNLFTLSANGCLIQNIEFFAGVASVNPTGCVSITGERNVIDNCQISGIGHLNNDISGAYSLKIAGNGENIIKNSYIGLDTILRTTNEAEVRITDGSRNRFENCILACYTASTTYKMVLFTVTTAHSATYFKGCIFENNTNRTSTVTTTGAIDPTGISGHVVVSGCAVAGFSGLVTADSTLVKVAGPAMGAAGKDVGMAISWDLT